MTSILLKIVGILGSFIGLVVFVIVGVMVAFILYGFIKTKLDKNDVGGKPLLNFEIVKTMNEYISKYSTFILIFIAYVIANIIIKKAFPELWTKWWDSGLFSLSHVAIILSFWLLGLKSKRSRAVAVVIWILLLTVVGISNWPEGPPNGTGTGSSYVQTTNTMKEVVALPGKWTAVKVDEHYNGRWFKDGNRKFANLKRLVKVRFNGKIEESEKMTPEGNIIEVNYKSGEPIRLIEFQALGTESVYIIVEFIKKSNTI